MFSSKKAKWAMNEGQKGQINYSKEVVSAKHQWRCVFPNKNDYPIISLIWSIIFIIKRPNRPYKGQRGQISYLIEITSLTLHWRCVFSQEKWLSYYSINLVNCFHQKKAKWPMNEGQKGQFSYLKEVVSATHHWRCVFLNKNE